MTRWADVSGYEGFYQVSDEGDVKSLDRLVRCRDGRERHMRSRPIRPIVARNGRLIVGLNRDGRSEQRFVHRLVAEAFVPGWFDGAIARHVDGDRRNNSAENLEWVDHAENYSRNQLTKDMEVM